MMNDPARNPLTHDWNKVLLPYCDGGSFAGNLDGSVPSRLHETNSHHAAGPVDLFFRGFRNLNAVADALQADHGLGNATHVLISGDSAGGLATYWHASWCVRAAALLFRSGAFAFACVCVCVCACNNSSQQQWQ